ncbi:MAG: Uma2 family endonuclease [Nostoc sp. DedQUE08]|uniref:Uma2 family endonuclease n=1 Tax=Nostoc sp. DedQUE08 TaxID=3075393 RepID=UPI002AD3A9A6|nr:Uma2 family endonuclease [Nostoc sp. DedQUE08]MDZ8068255.1 Uma2 family endonuclease [Nostoc sp. DedQUE08]
MTQAIPKLVTFEDFAAWLPEGGRYELHDGVIVEMAQSVGDHEDIIGFLVEKIAVEYVRNGLPYFIPKTALVKSAISQSCYSPDLLLLNRPALKLELLWQKYSTVEFADSIPLVIEVISTNWRDDYYKKLGEYEQIGIKEYWIVDYLAIGGKKFIGNPRQPTISIYQLVDGEYRVTQLRGNDRIVSPIFPELNLIAQQILQAGSSQF